MGTNMPPERNAALTWLEQRIALWIANADSIGLTSGQTTLLNNKILAARAASDAALLARDNSKSATLTFYNGADDMKGVGADLVKTIKAFAATTGGPSVYTLANLSPPAPPSPVGPPVPATDLRGSINSDGAVELAWNGTLENRTFYEVLRKLDGEPGFTRIDSVGAKRYSDYSLPSDVPGCAATYIVRAKRGSQVSVGTDPIIIRFGVDSGDSAEGGTALGLAA